MLTQYRNTLAAQGQQVDKNTIKNMFIQLVGNRGSVRRETEPVISASQHPGGMGLPDTQPQQR